MSRGSTPQCRGVRRSTRSAQIPGFRIYGGGWVTSSGRLRLAALSFDSTLYGRRILLSIDISHAAFADPPIGPLQEFAAAAIPHRALG